MKFTLQELLINYVYFDGEPPHTFVIQDFQVPQLERMREWPFDLLAAHAARIRERSKKDFRVSFRLGL